MSRPRATHCKNNHEFTPENTYVPPGRPTSRMCLTCHRDRSRKRSRPPELVETRAANAALRAELESARRQLRQQQRTIADLERELARLRSKPALVTHRRIRDGGIGGRAEAREMRRKAA